MLQTQQAFSLIFLGVWLFLLFCFATLIVDVACLIINGGQTCFYSYW